jgi:hypothetical protein
MLRFVLTFGLFLLLGAGPEGGVPLAPTGDHCDDAAAQKMQTECRRFSKAHRFDNAEKACMQSVAWAETCGREAQAAHDRGASFDDREAAIESGAYGAIASRHNGHQIVADSMSKKTIALANLALNQNSPAELTAIARHIRELLRR